MPIVPRALATALALLALVQTALAGEITGAGSSFAAPILSKWSAEYGARTGRQ